MLLTIKPLKQEVHETEMHESRNRGRNLEAQQAMSARAQTLAGRMHDAQTETPKPKLLRPLIISKSMMPAEAAMSVSGFRILLFENPKP